jgi:predicted  nucleic acid-binding Zn-ribbon protein
MKKLEEFRILREIHSLRLNKEALLKDITGEKERISKVNGRKTTCLTEQKEAKKSLTQVKDLLGQMEAEIEKTSNSIISKKENLKILISEKDITTMQSDIKNLGLRKDDLEEKGMFKLEEIEKIQEELADHKLFLSGIDEGILEISTEAQSIIDKHNIEIENLKKRYFGLKEQLSKDFQAILGRLNKKNFILSPFTSIKGSNCHFCGLEINRTLSNEIDIHHKVAYCGGCSRLILPHSVVS